MAEVAVSFLSALLVPLLGNEATLLRGVHREFRFIEVELDFIQPYLKDADRRAANEGEEFEVIKTSVKQLRELSFRLEDVADEYQFYLARCSRDFGCAALPRRIGRGTKTLKTRHEIGSEIQDIKLTLNQLMERRQRYGFQRSNEQGSSSEVDDPRMQAHFIDEAEVVGFEVPKRQLLDWLLDREARRTTISIVGMGALGKTTLAKKVFDSQEVIKSFRCRAWITVSQAYTVEEVLREMMKKFCKARREPLPEDLYTMDRTTLTEEMKNYLQNKRYVVFFDDVWNEKFLGEIQLAMPENNNRSRIVITTRNMGVADSCKISSICHVYEQKPLSVDDAWKLFCKKTFQPKPDMSRRMPDRSRPSPDEHDVSCPPDLKETSKEIVRRCDGLPLAIVTIAGLLATKRKDKDEWIDLLKTLSLQLEINPHLSNLTRILAFSYDDLPYYLKSCFLYFGIYPEDYTISCERLTKKWIAEGFVQNVEGKTLEEVADGYLTELIHRSLVQVSLIHLEGKAKTCRIHDMLREMIIRKMKDLSFARFVHDDDQSISDTITRRLAIATSSDSVLGVVGHSHIRAVYIFESNRLLDSFLSTFLTKSRHLKVLDFENAL